MTGWQRWADKATTEGSQTQSSAQHPLIRLVLELVSQSTDFLGVQPATPADHLLFVSPCDSCRVQI